MEEMHRCLKQFYAQLHTSKVNNLGRTKENLLMFKSISIYFKSSFIININIALFHIKIF